MCCFWGFLVHLQQIMQRIGHTAVLCLCLVVLLMSSKTSMAQSVVADSTFVEGRFIPAKKIPAKKSLVVRKGGWWQEHSDYTTRFRAEQLVVPGALFLVGTLGIGENAPMRGINLAVRDGMASMRKDLHIHIDDYMQYLPVATYLGLCTSRRIKAKHTVPERICVAAVTYISMAALTNALKYTIREQRPDSATRNAFPLGHTATAFAGAELVRAEYGVGYGIAAYTVATGVAFMRLYNGRHWLNDVLAGAGIGIISARIGYWMLPLNRKIFKMDRRKTIVTTPMYYPEQNALGMACAMNF